MTAGLTAKASTLTAEITTDSTGKTLAVTQTRSSVKSVTVQVQGVVAAEAGQYQVRYRSIGDVVDPFQLTPADEAIQPDVKGQGDKNLYFRIPADEGNMLIYNIWKREGVRQSDQEAEALQIEQRGLRDAKNSKQDELKQDSLYQRLFRARKAAIQELDRINHQWEADEMAADRDIERLEAEKASLGEEIEAYKGTAVDRAVREIRATQDRIRKVQEAIVKARTAKSRLEVLFDADQNRLVAARKAANDAIDKLPQSEQIAKINTRLKEIADLLSAHDGEIYQILKVGAVLLGKRTTAIHYALLHSEDDDRPSLGMKRMGGFPTLTQRDLIYAVVVNRQLERHPYPFHLSFTVTAGEVQNPAPIRPSFDKAGAKTQGGQATQLTRMRSAYRDVVLPFGRRFRGNDELKVTISVATDVVTKDETTTTGGQATETKTITFQTAELIDDEEYPQIRALYHYNFNVGTVATLLRNPSFIRSPLTFDDPATSDVNEATFETKELRGDVQVKPVAALTFYPRPLDIQRRLTWLEVLTPNPTLGFSLTSPNEDFFLGLSHEVVRNTQLFYGLHVGRIDRLTNPGAIDDPSSNAAPATSKKFDKGFFFGLTFNMTAVTGLFTPK